MYPVYKKDTRNQSLETSFPATRNEKKNLVFLLFPDFFMTKQKYQDYEFL